MIFVRGRRLAAAAIVLGVRVRRFFREESGIDHYVALSIGVAISGAVGYAIYQWGTPFITNYLTTQGGNITKGITVP